MSKTFHIPGGVTQKSKITTVTDATVTLTADQSGTCVILSRAGGVAVTLPAPTAGVKFKIINGLANTTNHTITSVNSSSVATNLIHGLISSAEDAAGAAADTAGTAVDVITMVQSKCLVGNYVALVCDGTNWFVSGMVSQQDGITLA